MGISCGPLSSVALALVIDLRRNVSMSEHLLHLADLHAGGDKNGCGRSPD
jgi:hypothetical protein